MCVKCSYFCVSHVHICSKSESANNFLWLDEPPDIAPPRPLDTPLPSHTPRWLSLRCCNCNWQCVVFFSWKFSMFPNLSFPTSGCAAMSISTRSWFLFLCPAPCFSCLFLFETSLYQFTGRFFSSYTCQLRHKSCLYLGGPLYSLYKLSPSAPPDDDVFKEWSLCLSYRCRWSRMYVVIYCPLLIWIFSLHSLRLSTSVLKKSHSMLLVWFLEVDICAHRLERDQCNNGEWDGHLRFRCVTMSFLVDLWGSQCS